MPIIEVENLSYSYDAGKKVLNGLNFSIDKGSINGIIGLSGCGKTTLCYALCGIIPQILGGEISGQILLKGNDIASYPLSKLAQQIGLVMQNPDQALVTTTVEDELAFAPENLCLSPLEIRARVDRTLDLLHLKDLCLKNPNSLSGGQKQLVSLGAVLTLNPDILVLDEPLSQLDQDGRELVTDAMISLSREGKTIIIVEHDIEVVSFADKWLVMGNGCLLRHMSPKDVLADPKFLLCQHLF